MQMYGLRFIESQPFFVYGGIYMKSSNIGGQAVLEGIMMKNGPKYAVAVRKPDGEIEVKVEEYKSVMAGIYTTSVNEETLDEAPMAYKSLEDIIDVIRESVDILDIMKPIYNFKAN